MMFIYTLSRSIKKTDDDEGNIFEFETELYVKTIIHQYSTRSIEINQVKKDKE